MSHRSKHVQLVSILFIITATTVFQGNQFKEHLVIIFVPSISANCYNQHRNQRPSINDLQTASTAITSTFCPSASVTLPEHNNITETLRSENAR